MLTDYIRLLRPPNLIIVALTQALVYSLMLLPAYRAAELDSDLSPLQMALLIICTLCITAGGNVVNDIYDREIDGRNKPNRTIVGRSMSVGTARFYYGILTATGLVIAIYLGLETNNLPWLLLYPAACLLLWAYSGQLKCRPVLGNWTVSLFCALVVGIVWFAERRAFTTLQLSAPETAQTLARDLWFYMGFAFLATWFRELVKDIEDLPGDMAAGCRTLAVRTGPTNARNLSLAVLLGLAAMLLIYFGSGDSLAGLLWFAPVWLCLLLAGWYLLRVRETKDFSRISRLGKLIILLGLLLFPFLNQLT